MSITSIWVQGGFSEMDLNILGADVTVYVVDPEMLEGHRGEAKFKLGEIWISSDIEDDLEYHQVLFHEIMHWVLHRCGLDEGSRKKDIEQLCDVVGFVMSENVYKIII